mmetsp:Transcript_67498/g.111017  ORF Transcript_67498/g.111017 Transcript_67498/m.111017 type:complete len:118 (-) Transcript_67498:116-469(-)
MMRMFKKTPKASKDSAERPEKVAEGHHLAGFNLIFETENEPICQKQVEDKCALLKELGTNNAKSMRRRKDDDDVAMSSQRIKDIEAYVKMAKCRVCDQVCGSGKVMAQLPEKKLISL